MGIVIIQMIPNSNCLLEQIVFKLQKPTFWELPHIAFFMFHILLPTKKKNEAALYTSWMCLSFRDCLYLCLLNSATSVVAGFAIFSILGFMTYETGIDIAEVAESGKCQLVYSSNLLYVQNLKKKKREKLNLIFKFNSSCL